MGGQRGRTVRRVLGAASLACGLGAQATTTDAEGRIVLTAEEKAACAAEGGCVLMTRRMLAQIIAELDKPAGKCGPEWKRTT